MQPYGTTNSYTWMSGAGDAGSHTVRISVRNSGSTADAEDARTIPIEITTGSASLTVPASVLLARGSQPPEPIALSFTARFASATSGDLQKYSLYTPELNLMSETEMSSSGAPAMAYDYIWFGGKPVGQVDIATCVPPVGTLAYREDTDPHSRPHRGVPPPHWKLYEMHQSPPEAGCRCFWHPIPDNKGGFGASPPPPGTGPITEPAGGGLW